MASSARFCSRCGATLPQNAAFCHNCGAPVMSAAPPTPPPTPGYSAPPPPTPPTWDRRHEKGEKNEKREKNEKNEKGEKGRGGDLAGALTGGLILILLGLLLYLAQANLVAITWTNWWEYFLIGIGFILIIQGLVRYAERGHPYYGSFIGGIVLVLIGSSFVEYNNILVWPLLFVALGALAIVSAFAGRRRNPVP